jgi:hypothetical protein
VAALELFVLEASFQTPLGLCVASRPSHEGAARSGVLFVPFLLSSTCSMQDAQLFGDLSPMFAMNTPAVPAEPSLSSGQDGVVCVSQRWFVYSQIAEQLTPASLTYNAAIKVVLRNDWAIGKAGSGAKQLDPHALQQKGGSSQLARRACRWLPQPLIRGRGLTGRPFLGDEGDFASFLAFSFPSCSVIIPPPSAAKLPFHLMSDVYHYIVRDCTPTMRLINTRTLKLQHFLGKVPPYAILSHTWGREEVSFHEFQDEQARQGRVGFSKIEATCRQAYGQGLDYAWVDTCCIDKTSSAELGEAINSMYKWYKNSAICYALLEDVYSPAINSPAPDTNCVGFRHSRWFTRGWTLQELIAPCRLDFFNHSWIKIAEKSKVARELAGITGVDAFVLDGSGPLHMVSVGRRMSWAVHRKTTREEDIAYSLFGLFDVNMPLIYGEGQKAFQRLQEQILQQSDDQTIFAWRAPDHRQEPNLALGLLATSPGEFWNFRDNTATEPGYAARALHSTDKLVRIWGSEVAQDPIAMSNKGIRITSLIKDIRYPWAPLDLIILVLNCSYDGDSSTSVGIYLQRQGNDRYARVRVGELVRINPSSTHTSASIYGIRSTSDISEQHYEQPWTTSARVYGELNEAKGTVYGDEWIRKHYEGAFYLKRRYFKIEKSLLPSKVFSLSRILVMDPWGIWRSFRADAQSHAGDVVMRKRKNFKAAFWLNSHDDSESIIIILGVQQLSPSCQHTLKIKHISSGEARSWHNNVIKDGLLDDIAARVTAGNGDFQDSTGPLGFGISLRRVMLDGIPVQSVETSQPALFWFTYHVLRDNYVFLAILIMVIPSAYFYNLFKSTDVIGGIFGEILDLVESEQTDESTELDENSEENQV